ncbi:hypothetical protein AAG906_029293 [Vitis piasezkii]
MGMMKCKVEKFEVEKKSFQVKFEGSNGGTWVSITERSRGFVVSVGFGKEELDWLTEHLKKVVEAFHENHRDCYKRKPLLLVIPEGVKGNGWEDLRKAILSVQDYSDQVGGDSKETFGDTQMSKGIYRGGRSYAEVVAEDGFRTGVPLLAGKWARAGCFFVSSARRAEWFQEQERLLVKGRSTTKIHFEEVGRVTKMASEVVKLLDLTKHRGNECYSRKLLPRARYRCSSTSLAAKRENGWEGSSLGPAKENVLGPIEPETSFKAQPVRAQRGRRSRGLHAGPDAPQAHETVAASSPSLQRVGSSAKAITQPCPGDERAGVEVIYGEDGRVDELKAQTLSNPSPPSEIKDDSFGRRTVGCWSRREESAARKGKAPVAQMRDSTQEEKTIVSRKMWSNLFLQVLIADKDIGVAASLFSYGVHRHLAKSAIWKWISRRDLRWNEVSERVLSSAIFCQGNVRVVRGKRPRRQEERRIHEIPISKKTKKDLRAEWGTILVVLQSRIYLLFQESEPPESSSFPSCSLEMLLPSPFGPHLPNSVSLSQSPTEENQSAFSNQLSESSTPRKSSNLLSTFLLMACPLGKWLKCERFYALWTLRYPVDLVWRVRVCVFFHENYRWNTKGLGSSNKRRVIKDFLRSRIRMFVGSVWTVRNKDWVVLSACGASGGILFIWD